MANEVEVAHFRKGFGLYGARYFETGGTFEYEVDTGDNWDNDWDEGYEIRQELVPAGHWAFARGEGCVLVSPDQIGPDAEYQVLTNENGEQVLFKCEELLAQPLPAVHRLFDEETGRMQLGADDEDNSFYHFLTAYHPAREDGSLIPVAQIGGMGAVATARYEAFLANEDTALHAKFLEHVYDLHTNRGNVLTEADGYAFSSKVAEMRGEAPEQIYGSAAREERALTAEQVPQVLRALSDSIEPEGDGWEDEDEYGRTSLAVTSLSEMFRGMGGEASPMARMGKKMLGHYCPLDIEDVSLTLAGRDTEGDVAQLYDFIVNHEQAEQLEVEPFGNYRAEAVTKLDVEGVEMLAVKDFVGIYVYAWPGTSELTMELPEEPQAIQQYTM